MSAGDEQEPRTYLTITSEDDAVRVLHHGFRDDRPVALMEEGDSRAEAAELVLRVQLKPGRTLDPHVSNQRFIGGNEEWLSRREPGGVRREYRVDGRVLNLVADMVTVVDS